MRQLKLDKCELEERLQLMCISLSSITNAEMRVRAIEEENTCLDNELRALGAINAANVEQLRALGLERDDEERNESEFLVNDS